MYEKLSINHVALELFGTKCLMLETDQPDIEIPITDQQTRKDPILLSCDDNIDLYIDKFKKLSTQFENYVLTTPGVFFGVDRYIPNLNILAQCNEHQIPNIDHSGSKPFDFLFLVGKNQPWRRELVKLLLDSSVLENSLWSYTNKSENNLPVIKKLLPPEYEWEEFKGKSFDMHDVRNQQILPKQYQDTVCSIVVETSISKDRIYITEKTWKPLLAGHLFITMANPGYMKFLKSLGFKDFSKLWNHKDFMSAQDIVDVCIWIKSKDKQWLYDQTRHERAHNKTLARDKMFIMKYHKEQCKKYFKLS